VEAEVALAPASASSAQGEVEAAPALAPAATTSGAKAAPTSVATSSDTEAEVATALGLAPAGVVVCRAAGRGATGHGEQKWSSQRRPWGRRGGAPPAMGKKKGSSRRMGRISAMEELGPGLAMGELDPASHGELNPAGHGAHLHDRSHWLGRSSTTEELIHVSAMGELDPGNDESTSTLANMVDHAP